MWSSRSAGLTETCKKNVKVQEESFTFLKITVSPRTAALPGRRKYFDLSWGECVGSRSTGLTETCKKNVKLTEQMLPELRDKENTSISVGQVCGQPFGGAHGDAKKRKCSGRKLYVFKNVTVSPVERLPYLDEGNTST